MKQLLITLLFIYATAAANAQDVETKTISNSEYQIEYPTTWIYENSGTGGSKFLIVSPKDGANDRFRENVNLIVQDLSASPMTLDEFTELSLSQYASLGVEVLENKRTANPLRQMLVINMDQSGYELKLLQYYWIVNDQAYVLTLTCLKNDQERYWKDGQKIMDSFKIK